MSLAVTVVFMFSFHLHRGKEAFAQQCDCLGGLVFFLIIYLSFILKIRLFLDSNNIIGYDKFRLFDFVFVFGFHFSWWLSFPD